MLQFSGSHQECREGPDTRYGLLGVPDDEGRVLLGGQTESPSLVHPSKVLLYPFVARASLLRANLLLLRNREMGGCLKEQLLWKSAISSCCHQAPPRFTHADTIRRPAPPINMQMNLFFLVVSSSDKRENICLNIYDLIQ